LPQAVAEGQQSEPMPSPARFTGDCPRQGLRQSTRGPCRPNTLMPYNFSVLGSVRLACPWRSSRPAGRKRSRPARGRCGGLRPMGPTAISPPPAPKKIMLDLSSTLPQLMCPAAQLAWQKAEACAHHSLEAKSFSRIGKAVRRSCPPLPILALFHPLFPMVQPAGPNSAPTISFCAYGSAVRTPHIGFCTGRAADLRARSTIQGAEKTSWKPVKQSTREINCPGPGALRPIKPRPLTCCACSGAHGSRMQRAAVYACVLHAVRKGAVWVTPMWHASKMCACCVQFAVT
jgi:hypothetical protein